MMDPTPTPRSPYGSSPPPGQAARDRSAADPGSALPRYVEPTLPTRLDQPVPNEAATESEPEPPPTPTSPSPGESVHSPYANPYRYIPTEFEFSRPQAPIPQEEIDRVAAVLEMLSGMLRSRGSQVVYGWGEPRDLESALQFYVKGYLLGRNEREKYGPIDG